MCNYDDCKKTSSCGEYNFPPITSAFFVLTEQCNLKCTYCFVKQNPKQMTLDVAKKALDFLVKNSEISGDTPSVNFFGGEPMLKFDEIIKPLIKYAEDTYDKKVKWSITSNGTLFTEENLTYFKEKNVGILLSLDGCEASQDANRVYHNGKGSFERINKILDLYLELNKNGILRATIERNTVKYFMDSVRFGMSKPFSGMFFIPNSFVDWNDEEKEELKNQVKMFADLFIEHCRQGEIVHLSPFEDKIRSIVKINKAIDFPIEKTYKSKCGLGGNKFASVGTDGKLYGCQEMTSNENNDIFIIGDIYNGTDDGLRKKLVESFSSVEVANHDRCKTCKLQPICTGGCVANNYLQTGNMTMQADIMCFWEQTLLEEAIRVCRVLGEERNELFRKEYFSKSS